MRPIWAGAISFGLIHIPIKLFSASKERAMKFEYLRKKDLCPIGYVKVCKSTGEEVPWGDVVKGYKYGEGDFVVLTDEDFKDAAAKKSEVIEIEDFVDEKEIDPIYYSKPYYLGPDSKSDKVYNLLLAALKRTKKIGIGKFVLKAKEHLVALKGEKDVLMIMTLRLNDEIRPPTKEVTPKRTELSERELVMAMKLIDKLSGTFDPSKYEDTYSEKLEEIIEEKAKGKRKVTRHKKTARTKATKVPDLMATLKASLEAHHKKTHGKPARKKVAAKA